MRAFLLTSLTLSTVRFLDTPTTLRSISALINRGIQSRRGYVAVMLQARTLFVSHVAEHGESEGHADDNTEGYAEADSYLG